MKTLTQLTLLILSVVLMNSSLYAQDHEKSLHNKKRIQTITNDGAWCWFSDPRSIYLHGDRSGIITGWVKKDGTIETAVLDLKPNEVQSEVLYPELEKDDHDNPSFLALPNNERMVFYTKHCNKNLYYHHQNEENKARLFAPVNVFDPISNTELKKFPRRQVTYANPYVLKAENNRIYCFGRWTGFKPNVMWSDDMGKTFNQSKVFIAEDGFRADNRPYVKYFSDGKSRIHIVFTDGHPRNEATNSLYYAYYEKGAFWRIDGSKICSLDEIPFKATDASVIYKATETSGRAWVYDVCADKKGNPVVLYARYPKETEHLYHYAIYDGKKWEDHQICKSGKWFPQTPQGKREREPHYSGGMTLHPRKLNEIYLSREINGIFEIEKRVTKDQGKSWKITPITQNSTFDNVRPYIPRNMYKKDKTVVLWMENEKYVHYTDYKSKINYVIEP